MAAVHYHQGAFPPAKLDWPRLIPLLGSASAVADPVALLRINWRFERNKTNRGESMSHKPRRLGAVV